MRFCWIVWGCAPLIGWFLPQANLFQVYTRLLSKGKNNVPFLASDLHFSHSPNLSEACFSLLTRHGPPSSYVDCIFISHAVGRFFLFIFNGCVYRLKWQLSHPPCVEVILIVRKGYSVCFLSRNLPHTFDSSSAIFSTFNPTKGFKRLWRKTCWAAVTVYYRWI